MWRFLTIIFQTIISVFIFIYFRSSKNFFSLVYNRDLLKSFLRFFFVLLGIIIRLFLDNKTLNPQDRSYDFHNLASTNANYLKLNFDDKVKFLLYMLIISSLFIFVYGLIFILLLLPFRTIILAILTQISGIDFAGLIENITQVYIPSFNFWLTETFGLTAPQIPNYSPMSIEDINRINEVNQLNSEIIRLNEAVNNFISSKETDSLTASLIHTPDLTSSDGKTYITSFKAEWNTTTIILFTFGGLCLISSALMFSDHGVPLQSSITTLFNYTGGFIYNAGGFIYNTGESIYNSITGFFHGGNTTNVAPLIDPDTPTPSSGFSKYFGQGNDPTSPTPSSTGSTSTVKPNSLLVDTKVQPSSSLLTSRSNS
jgi:hypothetical protein